MGGKQQAAPAYRYEAGVSPRAPAWHTHCQHGTLGTAPLGRRTRSYGTGQLQASPDVPDVPGLKPGPLGPDTCRRAQPRAAPVVMWGGQVSKHVSGMRVHTSSLLVDDRRSGAWRTRELLTWPWDCTLRARVRQAGSGTRRAQGTGGGTPVRVTGRRCASRLHRTAHTSGSNQTIQPGPN